MNDTSQVTIQPDYSFHPGAILERMLDERGIRQTELAERTGLTAKHINQIVRRSVTVTPDVAVLLERALNTPHRFWGSLAADWEMHTSEARAQLDLRAHGQWAQQFHLDTLVRHEVVAASDSAGTRSEKILRFFGVASPEAFELTWMRPRVSFRRSQRFTVHETNTALWLRLVERCAENMTHQKFRRAALKRVAAQVPQLTNLSVPAGFVAARAALADVGVSLVFVRQVPGTRVTAATWWLDSERPVIGMTERNRRPDIFWFSLLHEIGHLNLHPRRETFLDLERDKKHAAIEVDPAEDEADRYAEKYLCPPTVLAQIAAATTREHLILIAAQHNLGLPIVAGQHGHLTGKWAVGGKLRGTISDADIAELEEACSHH